MQTSNCGLRATELFSNPHTSSRGSMPLVPEDELNWFETLLRRRRAGPRRTFSGG